VISKPSEPCARGLTKPVQRLVEETDGVWVLIIDKTCGLLTENVFLQVAVKERVGHIELSCGPATRGGNGEHCADCGRLDDRREGFAEVNARALREPTDHPPGFIALEGSIRIELVAKYPFARDDMGTRWTRNQTPCVVCLKSAVLLFHGAVPVRISKRGARRGWQRGYGGASGRWRRGGGERIAWVGFDDASLSASDHRMCRRRWRLSSSRG